MKRRDICVTGLAAAGALAWPEPTLAQRQPREGEEYRPLGRRAPVEAPAGKIEVVEFFWYSCPHCNAFEPKLVSWIRKLPADVQMRRVPVAFRDDFFPQQRLFYTLQAMGRLDDLHGKVFESIHVQLQGVNTQETILKFAERQGLDKAKFLEIYNSFSIATKARNGTQLQETYGVEGVPSMGVAGRWYTDGDMAGNMDRVLQVVDYLIAEARKSR